MVSKSLNELYTELLDKVYEDDLGSQMHYLSVVSEYRNISIEYLLQRGCMFIPNNDYITHYLGSDAYSYRGGLYRDESTCLWTLFMVVPILDFAKDIVGLVGWDAMHKYMELKSEERGLSTYSTSSNNIFKKEKYFLADVDLLQRKFDCRTIFITDGVFDSMALNYRGIPALALLGSTFSREIIYLLQWYKNIYVCADNDEAGLKLYRRLNNSLRGVHRVVQSKVKDIENFLRDESLDGPNTLRLLDALENPPGGDIYLK